MVKITSHRWIPEDGLMRTCLHNHWCEDISAKAHMEMAARYCGKDKEIDDQKLYELAHEIVERTPELRRIDTVMLMLNKFACVTYYEVNEQ